MVSDKFFEFLPKEITYSKTHSSKKLTQSLNNEELTHKNFSKLIRSGSILINSGI